MRGGKKKWEGGSEFGIRNEQGIRRDRGQKVITAEQRVQHQNGREGRRKEQEEGSDETR